MKITKDEKILVLKDRIKKKEKLLNTTREFLKDVLSRDDFSTDQLRLGAVDLQIEIFNLVKLKRELDKLIPAITASDFSSDDIPF